MPILSEIAHLFPITNPTWIFLVVLVIILFAPLIFNRIRVPHLVGMILAGVFWQVPEVLSSPERSVSII